MSSLNLELLARNINTLRKLKKLTLDVLAERSGISKGYLSRIENAQNDPSFSILLKISRALEVPIGALLDEESDPSPYVITRVADRKKYIFNDGTREYIQWALANSTLYKKMDPQLLEIPFQDTSIYQQNDERFLYVLEGKIQTIDGQILEQGDSAYIMPNTPHSAISLGEEKAKVLLIICP